MFRGNNDKPDARSKVQARRSLTAAQQEPRLDSADAQIVDYVLRGNVQQTLPQPQSKCIRLLLATSTYADFEAERECLWREIVPELQQFCLNYGAELFIIDPFQSSDKDLTDDPFLLQTLLSEIDQCRQLSAGLFFISLLGDKYGTCALPIDIRVEEYNHIRTAAFEASKDVRPLDDWYKLDNNSTPPTYALQSNGAKKKMDAKTRKALLDIIQKGAHQAHNEGLINQVSPKHQDRFFCSPIELMTQAALGANNATKNIFTVLRKFDGIKNDDGQTSPFLDQDQAGSITKPAERISQLKNMLTTVCDRNNIESFTVSWSDKMDAMAWLKSKEREKYLDQFTQQVTYKLKQLIGNAMGEWSSVTYNNLTFDNAYNEGLVHLNWAIESKAGSFVGQAKTLDKIKDLAQSAVKQRGVLVNIQGGDCSGKTAILCEVAHHVRNWLQTEPIIIVRSVGLTHSACFAHELWKCICMQICMAYELDTTPFRRTLRYDSLNKFMTYALEKVSASKQPLVLLIDDVHMIKYGRIFGGGCECEILPNPLPVNIIILCTSMTGTALTALPWTAALSSKNTLSLSELGENDLVDIVKNIVSVRGRKLTVDQLGLIKQRLSLKNRSNPFVATLLAEEAVTWGSHTQPKITSPVKTDKNDGSSGQLPSPIEVRLKQLEVEFGVAVLKSIGQYLGVSSHGLTEVELLDALSCNRELLRQIYADGDKKTQRSDLVGFPICIWLAIKKELGVLLKSVIYDNRRIVDWNHTSTCNLVRHRYLQNTADIKKCHSDLADLFGDVWSELASTVSMGSLDSGLNTTPARPRSSKLSRVPIFPQPLKSASLPGENPQFNVRRVRNLWYHVLHAGNIDYLKEQALCNFHYLDAVVQSCGLPHLLTVFEDTLQQVLHHDLQVVCEQVILPALPTLTKDRDQMAAEVIGRLRYTRAQNSHFLNTIVEQAMAWVDTYVKQPLLVPLTCWIRPPKLNLVFRFRLKDWQSSRTVLQPTLNHQHLLISGNNAAVGAIAMYHIASQTLVRTFTGHTDRVTSITLSNNGQFFVTTSLDKSVRTWDLMHGNSIRNFSPHSERIICSLMTHDDLFVITGSADSSAKVVSLENGRIVRSFQDHTGPVCALAITSGSEFLITGSGDFVVMVWDLETGQPVSRMGGLMAPVTCMTITSNDAFLVVSCEDETLRVFSLCSGTELHELSGHEGKVHTMIAAQDDCQLFAGCADGKIYCYDVHNGEILDVLQCASEKAVTALKITNDNYFLMSGSHDWVHVWNVEQRTYDNLHLMGQMTSSESPVTSVAMSRDQKYAACGTKVGVVALWDLEVCQCVWTAVQSRKEPITVLHLTQDSMRLLSGNSIGVVSIWDMANGALLRSYEGHEAEICGIQTVSDNSRVLSIDIADNLHVWMLEVAEDPDVETTFTIKGPRGLIKLCPNDRDLVGRLATNAKEVKIWTVGDDTVTPRAKIYHNEEITCMSVTSNGRLLVTGSMDQSLKVWDIETGFLTQVLVGHEDAVHCCAIADDERIVVSGAADKMVMIWEVATGDTMHTLDGHKDSTVSAVAVTSDGAVAFSADKNGWVQAWDTENGRLLSCFSAHRPVLELVPSFDANRIILRLEACPQLPILCLHNTPAGLLFNQPGSNDTRRRSTRTHSISSIGSNFSGSSGHGTMREPQTVGQPVASTSSETRSSPKLPSKSGKPAPLLKAGKTFDKLERSRSRASLYGDPTSTKISTLPSDVTRPPLATAIAPRGKVQSSNVCAVL